MPEISRRPAERTASLPAGSAGLLAARKGSLLHLLLPVALVLLLPLAGAAAMGKPLPAFLQFPPKTPDVTHAPFSLPVFLGLTLLILAATVPLLGVAGYLPFGVLCAGIGDLLVGFVRKE